MDINKLVQAKPLALFISSITPLPIILVSVPVNATNSASAEEHNGIPLVLLE